MAAQFTDKVVPNSLPKISPPTVSQLQVVIITGGNSGIGAACVASFRASGAIVIIFDIADAPEGKALPKRFNYKCNVASEESVNEAVKDVVDMFGRIDVLVNCAGVMDNCCILFSSLSYLSGYVQRTNVDQRALVIRRQLTGTKSSA